MPPPRQGQDWPKTMWTYYVAKYYNTHDSLQHTYDEIWLVYVFTSKSRRLLSEESE